MLVALAQAEMLGHDGEHRQQCQRIERHHGSAALERLQRHVEHGQMVGPEEGVELAALERLREAPKMIGIEIPSGHAPG